MAITAEPTGADLASGTTPGDTLPNWTAGPEEREITLGAGVELTSGVVYAIVVRALTAIEDDSDVLVYSNNSNPYADGNVSASNDSGSSWAGNESFDWWFKTKAGAVEKDTNEPATSNWEPAASNIWRAQTFTASSTYTITSVILKLERYQFDTTGTVTVSIKATEEVPTKAENPAPTDTASDVTLDQATLTWEDGGGADTYNVYYGDTSGNLTLVSEGQVGTSLTVTGITLGSPYGYVTTRYWRIDSINDIGTTTGDEWSFTTIGFHRLRVSYELISGGSGNGPYDTPTPGVEGTDFRYTGENNMITVRRLVAAANNKIWIEDT